MLTIFRHHGEVVVQCSGCNEDVRITDELTSLIQQRINVGSTNDDGIRQRQHLTALAPLRKTCQLANSVACLETPVKSHNV